MFHSFSFVSLLLWFVLLFVVSVFDRVCLFKSGHRYFDKLHEEHKTSYYDRPFGSRLMLKHFLENKGTTYS